MDVKKLQQERAEIYNDFWNNKIPKRIPVNIALYHHIYIEFSGKGLKNVQYDYSLLKDSVDDFCNLFYSDICPVTGGGRPKFPTFYQLLGARIYQMSEVGYMQHPDVSGMNEDEYDELIADPLAFIIDKVLPRQITKINQNDPVKMAKAMFMAEAATEKDAGDLAVLGKSLIEKYGYYSGAPKGSSTSTVAPFDYVADMIRGFSNICKDLRRMDREKIKAAADAVLPFVFRGGLPKNPDPSGNVGLPLHMPTFMRAKDVEELFLPSFKKMLEGYASIGVRMNVFCEDDYTRHVDYLQEFPANTLLRFEKGDPKFFKEKLGDKFLIGGFYPTLLIRTGTKQQCVDKMKELLDIVMPGGGYYFSFDKNPIAYNDINFENLKAMSEYLRDNAYYDNAGAPFGKKLNSEKFNCDIKKLMEYDSKYKFNWEEFKKQNPYTPDFVRAKLEKLDDAANVRFTNYLK